MDAYQANLAACGGDYEAAFAQKAANGINTYEECFFFGLDPMDDNARFVLRIKLKNSIPEITWEPVRDDRTYTVVAKESLTDTEWVPTEECANPHFFKVRVKLPQNLLKTFMKIVKKREVTCLISGAPEGQTPLYGLPNAMRSKFQKYRFTEAGQRVLEAGKNGTNVLRSRHMK